ncbi:MULTISPECIES: amidohydrolase family protein [unclassified Ruegeria]|uniref:amidohydrolase family protein n=1 Tax=unclassified Ruegeria TaxID=2625375 RepID=UPI001ADBAF1C|nr:MULTISPECIES: amidohydrolase family protein [unclassified Ruegeria]MBO9411890.1 amidohydrolase family protein [Ruegeria sp. R8_1]MBO9415549.1 amidohydrolase family protein [Ruegeria sp. R8_2]
MVDLLIKNATLTDGQTGMDIACQGDKITAVEAGITADAAEVIDAQGQLVSPPFVDPHFHMDATLSLGNPRMNVSGTLLEGIALWGELKPFQSVDDIVARALRYCELAVAKGIGAIRSHVDTCDDELKGVQALLQVREQVKDYLDLQLVAFPQDGVLRDRTAMQNTLRALDMGVDVVGGIPHFERTMSDGAESVRLLCEIAAERGLMVDMHCDESDDPHSRHIETLAFETQRLGLNGRVAGSHLTSMHSMDNYYVSKLIPLMVEAGVHAIPNPLINIMLQGRHDSYPKRRGQTRVRELRDAGITVGFGSDCVMDPWYSLGKADMLDVAFMGLHVGQLSSRADMTWCFEAVTTNSARIMGLDGYGVAKGCDANFVLLQASDPIEAIRLRAHRMAVVRKGRVISRSAPVTHDLSLPSGKRTLDEARVPFEG